jgi:tetratricopeptide (TPR) repeat protein
VGRADEANRDIDRALQLNPNFTDAFALQSIIAVVQNERERGLELARKAVSSDPKSSAALVALSYAQQASFDLEGARASLQQAVQVNPNDALAWARLAEMWLSFGRLNEALEAARKAVSLDPDLSRTQTVLGFVYLTQVNTEEAKKAFTRAAELDQGDPLARLGFGLAEIRDGNLEEGRREIEVAVGLDPNNALMRSYLGKAYFEEKREKQAGDQYQAAKELDPKDPTPYFYDAILKQTTNRPVEALQDMEQAIELNDNRAVYRSRLLLDSDLAARSAALGRIYTDLGFQQLALVEGWKSVNTDPSNFSAHRFLADSYAVLPRHEIARVSELLQSQLLQPLNTTPIQPQLAESNLFLLGAQGPANLSFNEFNPLFTRNGLNFQSTGLAGENATYAGEGVLSGVYKKASFSLGGYHFQTNGWRINSDQKDTIADGFFQFELSPDTSVQTEVRQRETRVGDIQQRFFPEDFFPGQREKRDSVAARFGVRHSFSPDSILLGSFMFQDRGDLVRIASPDGVTQVKFPENSTGIEWQHLWRSTYVNLTSGFGYFDVNGKVRTTLTFPPFFESDEVTDQGLHHLNSYSYAYIKPINTLTLTAGISFDHLNGPKTSVPHGDVEQFNPKAGITWNPFPSTTIRATAFRVIKRTLITDQTLEPTQVAGFNQFFDDVDITNSWRYGAGIDQKFTKHLFGGVEASRRDLRIPLIDATVSPPALDQVNAKERMVRTYLFWTPHPWVALRTEYNFERFVNGGALGEDGKVNTHRVPVGVNFFHPDGLGVSITGTYYHQDGEFMRLGGGTPESGRDQFWLLDATINYRLPKRYGFVTIGATNLLDKKFKYFETDVNNPRIQPKRTAFFKVTLALP